MNKLQMAEQFRQALQMFAASLSEDKALEIATVYPNWSAHKNYTTGDYLQYGENSIGDPQLYKVVQNHISQEDWLPSNTPSLYTALGLDDSGHPVWSQPTGAHDAYNKGDIVNYNGILYRSLVDGNTWSPEVMPTNWEVV